MSVPSSKEPRDARTPAARLLAHVHTPIYREGYSLATSAVLASSLGVIFWIMVARRYAPSIVGINAAAISALTLTGGVASLLVVGLIVRFVPRAGSGTRTLVVVSYGICACVAAVTAVVVLAVLSLVAPQLHNFLDASAGLAVAFVVASVVWSIFGLQDQVLTALQRAVLVPADNAVYAVTKILMLVAFAGALPRYGIFASWTASALVCVLVINTVIFAGLIPAHSAGADRHVIGLRSLASFAVMDYVGSLFWLAAITLSPIIVTVAMGATTNAFYALPFQMATLLYSLPMATGTAFLVATAREPEHHAENLRGVFIQTMWLVAPASVLLAVAAPYVLRLFGPEYARHGAVTLELLSLAAIPCVCGMLALNAQRVRRRMQRALVIRIFQSLPPLVIMVPCLHLYGIAGAAAAWLVTQTLVAVALLVFDRESVIGRRPRSNSQQGAMRMGASGPLPMVTSTTMRVLRDTAAQAHVLGPLKGVIDARATRQRRAASKSILPTVVATSDVTRVRAVSPEWRILSVIPTLGDRAVALAGDSRGAVVAMKIAESGAAVASLEREADTLRLVHGDPRFSNWHHYAPELLGRGDVDGYHFTAESAIDGWSLQEVAASPYAVDALCEAIGTLAGLHAATATLQEVGDHLFELWVDRPISELSNALKRVNRYSGWYAHALERELRERLRSRLVGRRLDVGFIHGDFVPSNVVVAPSLRVRGVIDWEQAQDDYPVRLDLLTMLLSVRMLQQRRELGSVIVRSMASGALTIEEQAWLGPREGLESHLDEGLMLMAWLHLVASSARKSTRVAANRVWLNLNVDSVLAALGE